MSENRLEHAFEWEEGAGDSADELFGDVVRRATLESADDFGAVLVGEPYDGAVIGRTGAREGPAAIREALASVKTHHFDAGPVTDIGDLGTIRLPRGEDVATVQDHLATITADIHATDALPVFLGGDNSLTVSNVSPLLDTTDSVGVINLDAHLDCRVLEDGPSSGTPYRQLLDAGLDDLVVLGARHFETSTEYAGYLREAGGSILTAEEVEDDPVAAANRALAELDVDSLYVSVDVDVLDATAAPGVSAPTPGGLTSRELFRLVRLLASDRRLRGFEMAETAPSLCLDGRTAETAARTVAHALAVHGGDGL